MSPINEVTKCWRHIVRVDPGEILDAYIIAGMEEMHWSTLVEYTRLFGTRIAEAKTKNIWFKPATIYLQPHAGLNQIFLGLASAMRASERRVYSTVVDRCISSISPVMYASRISPGSTLATCLQDFVTLLISDILLKFSKYRTKCSQTGRQNKEQW
jgi:hypothetical protein